MADRIILTNLQLEGVHGVHDWERQAPQPWEVDVELVLDLAAAGRSDDLAATMFYLMGIDPHTEVYDAQNRPHLISGDAVHGVIA